MTKARREVDQTFAVICYAAAVCIAVVCSFIVQLFVKSGNVYLYLNFLLPQVAYIGVYVVVAKVKYGGAEFVRKENVRPFDYLFCVLVAVGLIFFALYFNTLITKLFSKIGLHATVTVPRLETWYDYLLSAFIICVLPAIGEELIFRKAFLDGMRDVADHKAILLCGLAFALSHLNAAQTVHQFFLGCVLALCYVVTKNITVTMVMHGVNNAIALFLTRITGAEIWNNHKVLAVSCAVGAVLIAAGLAALLLTHKGVLNGKKNGRVRAITRGLILVLALLWAIAVAVAFLSTSTAA